MAATSKQLLMGRIGAAHGIKGEVRIQSFTEEPLALVDYGPLATNRPGLVIEIETARATTGSAGSASSGAKAPAPPHARMYVLRSAPEAPRSFNTMIGHHVRVTGTTTAAATTAPLAGRSPEATPYDSPVATPSAGASAPTPTGTAFDTANLPTLVVHGITSVASSCK